MISSRERARAVFLLLLLQPSSFASLEGVKGMVSKQHPRRLHRRAVNLVLAVVPSGATRKAAFSKNVQHTHILTGGAPPTRWHVTSTARDQGESRMSSIVITDGRVPPPTWWRYCTTTSV